MEETLFDLILDAAGSERRCAVLVALAERFAQPSHRTIQLVQLQRFGSRQMVLFFPNQTGTVATAMEQAMHHREEYGPLDRKPKASSTRQPLKNLWDLPFTPQPLKNEFRSQLRRRDDG